MSDWPKRPDGSNKTVGEMTREERSAVFKAATARLKAEFEHPKVQDAIARILNDDDGEAR